MQTTHTTAIVAAQARCDELISERAAVIKRLDELFNMRSKVRQMATPGAALDELLGNAVESYQQEFDRLTTRRNLLEKAVNLAHEEVGRIGRERHSLIWASAQPELLKLRGAALDALQHLADAIGAIDAKLDDLARQGASVTSGFILGHPLLNVLDLRDVVVTARHDLARDEVALPQQTTHQQRVRLLCDARVGGKLRRIGEVVQCLAAEAALLVLDRQAETTADPISK